MVGIVRKLDMKQVADVYLRFYPLFQGAYQDLGYPTGYFNDRLVQVIDSLLAPEARRSDRAHPAERHVHVCDPTLDWQHCTIMRWPGRKAWLANG